MSQKRSSRERYRAFVRDYKRKRLDDGVEPGEEASATENAKLRRENWLVFEAAKLEGLGQVFGYPKLHVVDGSIVPGAIGRNCDCR